MNNAENDLHDENSVKIQKELEHFLADDSYYHIPIYKSKKNNKLLNKKILVMSGGAIKGIAHIGVLKALETKNIIKNITTFAGTSVGSLILALYIIGYTADELYNIIKLFKIDKLKFITFSGFLEDYGLDSGVKMEYVVKRLISAKNFNKEITLKELYNKTNKTLILTTTCLNTMEAEYISYKNYPDISLYKAIRMSISIPIFYTPVKHNGYFYVDGGCIDNYPVHIFQNDINNVIGAYLEES